MPDYIIKSDAKQTSTLGKVKVMVEQVVGQPSQEAINTAVADYIEAHPGSLSPLSPAVKSALLQIAEKVAYIDENGESYYNALEAALTAKALVSITAVYIQTGTVYTTDSLDSLKADLVVTAYYDDGTTADVTSAATLSGTLEAGTSTITATYSGKSATFTVTVSERSIRVFVGKGVSGASITDNANRALSEPFQFSPTEHITIQWEGYVSGNAMLSLKNTTTNVNTIDTTSASYNPESYIGTAVSSHPDNGAWIKTDAEMVATKLVNSKWAYLTYSTSSGFGRLLFAGETDSSAPIPQTIGGYITIQGTTYKLVEADISDFE